MSPSSTTVEPRTVTVDYGCPAWCQRTDHQADQVQPGEAAVHYGPDFGAVYVQQHGPDLEAVIVISTYDVRAADPAELRDVAADMMRAAQWLEVHQ